MRSSAFRVLAFRSTMGVRRIFSRWANHIKFHFTNSKLAGIHFSSKKMYRKISNFRIQGIKPPPCSPSDAHELDQIRKSILWRVRGSHEHQLSQGFQCTFFILRGFKQTNRKIPIIEICFERRSDTILLKEACSPLPLKIWFLNCKDNKAGLSWSISFIDLHLLSSSQMCFRTYILDFP